MHWIDGLEPMVSPEAFRFARLVGLGFTETSFAEVCNAFDRSAFRELLDPYNQCLSDTIALMIAVQIGPVRKFPDTLKGFEKVANRAKVTAKKGRETHMEALTSIPPKYHRQLGMEGIAASVETFDRLSVGLSKSVDSQKPLREVRVPPIKNSPPLLDCWLSTSYFMMAYGLV